MALDLLNTSVFEKNGYTIFHGLEKLVKQGCIYQHQAEAVKAIREQLEHQPTGFDNLRKVSLAVLPTGSGKTGVGVLAAYACGAYRVLVITPSVAISMQQMTQFTPVDLDMPEDETSKMNPLKNQPFLQSRKIIADGQVYMASPINALCALNKTDLLRALANKRINIVITNVHKFGSEGGSRGFPIEKYPRNYFSLVIVDEAHHFPAPTWKNIVDHFQERAEIGILFLTATPFNRETYILSLPNGEPKKPCYEYTHSRAVEDGIIRKTKFVNVPNSIIKTGYSKRDSEILSVLEEVKRTLKGHDELDKTVQHKAMILAADIEEAKKIPALWHEGPAICGKCQKFVQGDHWRNVEKFKGDNDTRALVIIFRLTEGFDHKSVSVAAILRNVSPKSRVYFAQFVGRAVRKMHQNDSVLATIISHEIHNQQPNYNAFETATLAQEDPEELPEERDHEEQKEEQMET